jgi:hypothetical protein
MTLLRTAFTSLAVLTVGMFATVTSQGGQKPKAQDLSGPWTITTFGVTWSVKLERLTEGDDESPLFCGKATGKDNQGKPMTNQLCAKHMVDLNVLRVSVLTEFQFACEAPFKATGTMKGHCVVTDPPTGASGPFKASRTPKEK